MTIKKGHRLLLAFSRGFVHLHLFGHRLPVGRIVTWLILCLWSVVCAFPLYWLALASIKSVVDLDRPPAYLPFWDFMPSLDAWRFILANPTENLLPNLFNSLLIGAAAALLSLFAALAALYGMTRMPARPRWLGMSSQRSLLWLMLTVRVVPPVVIALPLYVLAQHLGLLDTRSLIIGVYAAINLPVAIWMLIPVVGQRRTEQEEAALLDGASHWEIFRSVVVPMSLGPIAITGVFVFLLCWNEYLFAAYLTYEHAATLSPWMAGQLSMKEAQAGGEAEELSHMAAAAVFMAFPALVLASAVQRLIGRSFASAR